MARNYSQDREKVEKYKQYLKGLLQHPEDISYEDVEDLKLVTQGEVCKKLFNTSPFWILGVGAVGLVLILISIGSSNTAVYDILGKIGAAIMSGGMLVGIGSMLASLVGAKYVVDPDEEEALAYVQAVKELKKENAFDYKKLKNLIKQYELSDRFVEDKRRYEKERVANFYNKKIDKWTYEARSRLPGAKKVREVLDTMREKKLDKIDREAQVAHDKRAGVKPTRRSKNKRAKDEVNESNDNITL